MASEDYVWTGLVDIRPGGVIGHSLCGPTMYGKQAIRVYVSDTLIALKYLDWSPIVCLTYMDYIKPVCIYLYNF